MVVMGVCAFILCNRHRWHIKQKNQKQWKHTKQIYPEQKTKKSCALHHLCPVHEVLTGIWNPLISAQIVNSFGQGKCTFDCQSGNLKKLCLWQPCLNKLMHVENWNTDHLQHYLYVDISYKFTLAWVFVSHACTQITINTFTNHPFSFTIITHVGGSNGVNTDPTKHWLPFLNNTNPI